MQAKGLARKAELLRVSREDDAGGFCGWFSHEYHDYYKLQGRLDKRVCYICLKPEHYKECNRCEYITCFDCGTGNRKNEPGEFCLLCAEEDKYWTYCDKCNKAWIPRKNHIKKNYCSKDPEDAFYNDKC